MIPQQQLNSLPQQFFLLDLKINITAGYQLLPHNLECCIYSLKNLPINIT
jgi:hypothetical protein